MTNNSVLITGGAKRIGRSTALFLASKNYDVAISYNKSANEARDLKSQIESEYGTKCLIYQCDISKKDSCLKLIKDVLTDLPDLNLLINNASIFNKSDPIEDFDDEYENNMAVHVRAPLVLGTEFAKNINSKNDTQGNIINMLDKNISRNSTQFFYYLLSKKTLDNLTKMLAMKLSPNIRVNAIAFGSVMSASLQRTLKDNAELRANIESRTPLQRIAAPSALADAAQFLASEASSFMTGEIVTVDGGRTLLDSVSVPAH